MATLTETAYHTRRLVKFGLIGILCLLIFKPIYSRLKEYWREQHPPAPPPPTVAFGTLPKISFPEIEKKDYLFKLETISGGLPDLANQAKVYFIPKGQPQFSSLDQAKTKARQLGFGGKAVKISESVYQWTERNHLLSTLEMNIIDNNFEIKRNWQENLLLISLAGPMNKEKAIAEAKSFLAKAGLLTERLASGTTKASYLKFNRPNFLPALSFSEAELTRVDFFSAPLDNLPLLSVHPLKALVSFLLKDAKTTEEKFLEIEYNHQPISQERVASYPLKTTAEAWSELRNGQAFIIAGQVASEEATIRSVYLAYFEAKNPTNYLMPIFVFEGDNQFYAYVSAVSSDWIEEEPLSRKNY